MASAEDDAVAEALTRMVSPADRVTFRVGSATDPPFEEACFDAAMLLHVGMSIEDRDRLCAAAARVLKPGSVLAVYDVMRVGDGELAFPVVWADTPAMSFVADPAAYRRALEAAGFDVAAEEDRRDLALELFSRIRARGAEGRPPPLGLHILMSPEARRKVANMITNLERGLVAPIEMVCRRRSKPTATSPDRSGALARREDRGR